MDHAASTAIIAWRTPPLRARLAREAQIAEAGGAQPLPIENLPSIYENGRPHGNRNLLPVQAPVFRPFRYQNQRVRVLGHILRRIAEFQLQLGMLLCEALHGYGIVPPYLHAAADQLAR